MRNKRGVKNRIAGPITPSGSGHRKSNSKVSDNERDEPPIHSALDQQRSERAYRKNHEHEVIRGGYRGDGQRRGQQTNPLENDSLGCAVISPNQ